MFNNIKEGVARVGRELVSTLMGKATVGEISDTTSDQKFLSSENIGVRIDPLQPVVMTRYGSIPVVSPLVGYKVTRTEDGQTISRVISPEARMRLIADFSQQAALHGRVTRFPDLATL